MKAALTFLASIATISVLAGSAMASCAVPDNQSVTVSDSQGGDSLMAVADTIIRLTEEDYAEVAAELGVEVAAMKAVVDIEAGRSHEGFYAPGKPLINFDLAMFRRFARKKGIDLARYNRTHPVVFARPDVRRYGSQQAAQQARYEQAFTIDAHTAAEGTFWGMFQIGGFNWRRCGADSIGDFVRRMSLSEREQLELFANFIKSTKLDKHLCAKNWAAFARGYNGPSYARRGYHTRLASAYARHKRLEAQAESTTPSATK